MSQVWLFIAPGLYAHEKKFAIPFVVFASVFFVGGTLFGHYILFQVAWGFFANFGAENEYVAFTPRLQDAFGLDRDPVGRRLASQPTLSRFENAVNGCALYRMADELATRVIERHRRRLDGRARCITIDLDPTDDPTHGAQQYTLSVWCSRAASSSSYRPLSSSWPGWASPRRAS